MGTLKATTNVHQGTIIDGVILGEPAVDADGMFVWDTHRSEIIDGGIDPEGVVAPNWVQPQGAHDALASGLKVFHDGKFWESTTANNVWEPGVSGWREYLLSGGPAPWTQPTGAHDAYLLNAEVTFNGQTWRNTGSNANVWQPGVFGWVVV